MSVQTWRRILEILEKYLKILRLNVKSESVITGDLKKS